MPRMLQHIGAARRPPRQAKAGLPPGRGGSTNGKGQPPFVPTDKQRNRVMTLVACGFTAESISVIMTIPESTLWLHFKWELEHGKLVMDGKILSGIVEMALERDKTMSIFYAKTRGGWKEPRETLEASTLFSINISNASSDAASEINVIARPMHSLPESEEEP